MDLMKERTMKEKLFVAICAVVLILYAAGGVFAGEKDTALKCVAEFEDGKLYKAGAVNVLELNGDYRQMGRQYGALLKDDLQAMLSAIEEFFMVKQGEKSKLTRSELNTIARNIFDRYPQRYKEIFYGMAETSDLQLENVLLVNALEWFPKICRLSFGHCSGISVWGPYTNGPVLFGRNNDDHTIYFNFARMVVAVFKPNDGSIPAALIGYPGTIYNATGMNAEGLFMELNSGNEMGFSLDRISIFTTIFSYLQDYHNLVELDRAMRSTVANMSVIITAADTTRGYSYEYSLWDMKRWDQDDEGIVAAANAYSHPGWNITSLQPKKEPGESQIRKGNLLKLGARYKGKITPEVMMKDIMNLQVAEGGAAVEGTIYQVVAAPAERKIWLRVPGGRLEWTEVPLAQIFQKKK